ncbi:hypothetical protein LUZ63_021111 [Rhynchospora breviuscula]|uniref:Large ribosomal subunit protein bL28c n=1 Tax=Rhynchospora breviuscula TaxID=2022672 RepID=A0A9Q0C058_9POAL|nr:hypothetical protein LUZ63_021111 [Rhynchospora breviuscula]
MAAVCQVTGAVPGFGHNVSHSHRRTKRRFDPERAEEDLLRPSLGRNIKLNVSRRASRSSTLAVSKPSSVTCRRRA